MIYIEKYFSWRVVSCFIRCKPAHKQGFMDAAVAASMCQRNAIFQCRLFFATFFPFASLTHDLLHFSCHALLVFSLGEQSAGLRNKSFSRRKPTGQAVDQSFAKRLRYGVGSALQAFPHAIPIVFLDTIGIFSVKL